MNENNFTRIERVTNYICTKEKPVIMPNDRKKMEELLAKQIDKLFENAALEACGIYPNAIEAEFKRVEVKELPSSKKRAVVDLENKA